MKQLLLSFMFIVASTIALAQWSSNPRLNTSVAVRENSQSSPNSVSDGNGGVIILYEERVQDPISSAYFSLVYAQRLSAAGLPLWGNMGKLMVTVPDYTDKVLVADGNGGVMFLYTVSVGGGSNLGSIYAQRIDANGDKLWGTNGVAITNINSEYGISNNILRDPSGNYVFAFANYANNEMLAQKLNSSGQLQWANGVVLNEGVSDEAESGFIYQDGAGYLFLWAEEYVDLVENEDATRVKWQRLNADGTKNGANVLLYDLVPSAGLTRNVTGLTTDGSGGFYLAIIENTNVSAKLYIQRILSNGTKAFNTTAWGNEVDASIGKLVTYSGGSYIDYGVALESDGAGGVIIGWTDHRAGNDGLYAQRFNAMGIRQWSSSDITIAASLVTTNFYDGALKTNIDGDFIFMVTKEAGANGRNLYVQKVNLAGAVLYPVNGVLAAGAAQSYKNGEMLVLADKVVLIWDEYRTNTTTDYNIYAQSIFINGSLTGTFPVLNVRNNKGFNNIQDANDDAATINNDEIQVAAGVYFENVTITKELKINGSNAGLAPWNWTNLPTVIKPIVTDFSSATALITIKANNVKIDGISFDGANDDLNDNSPRNINGKAVRAGFGIATGSEQLFSAMQISNNKLENFSGRAISLFSTGSNFLTNVSQNQIDNVVAINTTSSAGSAHGIIISGFIGEVKNNRITRSSTGIQAQFPANVGNGYIKILNNSITAYKNGIYNISATNIVSPSFEVSGNEVTKADYNTWTADGLNKTDVKLLGIGCYNLMGDNPILVKNNTVSQARAGVEGLLVQKSVSNPDRFKIEGGTYSNNYIGIVSYNTNNNTFATRMVLSGVSVQNSEFIGVLNDAQTGIYKSELALKDGVQVLHSAPNSVYTCGVSVYGAQAELTSLNDTKISGAHDSFIAISSPVGNAAPMNGLTVDGKDVTYDGTVAGQTFNNYKPSATIDLTLRDAVKARIYDGDRVGNTSAGKVVIPGTLPVSLIDFNAVLKNNGALITWTTASELNNKYFIIEKSADGIAFQPLTTINAKGTTAVRSNYQFTDVNFFQSAYYRLTQVDINGAKTIYDQLIKHVRAINVADKIMVYPNPVVNTVFVKSSSATKGLTAKLTEVTGKVLQIEKTTGSVITFNVAALPKGIYFVQSQDDRGKYTEKIVKQ